MADGAREAKAALRKRMKAMRAGLTADGLTEAGRAVADAVLGLPELAEPRVVAVYLSVRREVPTEALVRRLLAAGHTVAVPRVIDPRAGMELRRYVEPLSVDGAGLPTSDGPVVADADVALCPGLAFDLAGGRLGYGAGYYDRWLADRPGVWAVGLALDEAITDAVPMGPDDRPMAALVTPIRVVRVPLDKARVIARVRGALAEGLQDLGRMTAMARDEATSAESRPENAYDTRALEASYLAAGQGERLDALKRLAGWADQLGDAPMDAVGLGALAALDAAQGHRRRRQWTLFAPRGGLSVRVDGVDVQLVSVSSPLGAALVGLGAGDSEEVDGPAGPTAWTVASVG